MKEQRQLLLMRVLVVVFIAISVILALNPTMFIAQLMGISWGALAGSFLAPFLYGLYDKRTNRAGVWASFACGIGITVVNMLWPFCSSPINAGAIAMAVGFIVTPLVSRLTAKPDAAQVEEIFSCYEDRVVSDSKTVLVEEEA